MDAQSVATAVAPGSAGRPRQP